jgi:hypothetical protein
MLVLLVCWCDESCVFLEYRVVEIWAIDHGVFWRHSFKMDVSSDTCATSIFNEDVAHLCVWILLLNVVSWMRCVALVQSNFCGVFRYLAFIFVCISNPNGAFCMKLNVKRHQMNKLPFNYCYCCFFLKITCEWHARYFEFPMTGYFLIKIW